MSFGDRVDYGKLKVQQFDGIVRVLVKKKKFYHRGRHSRLCRAWKDIAGPEIFGATRILSYENGKLCIGVASSVLLHELQGFMRASIAQELKKTEGGRDVVDVFFMAC